MILNDKLWEYRNVKGNWQYRDKLQISFLDRPISPFPLPD